MKKLFLLIILVSALKTYGQRCAGDYLYGIPDSITSFFIGETHPDEAYFFSKRDSNCRNTIVNYQLFTMKICECLIKEKKLNQVILEFPVYAEYFFQRYYQTNNPDWLDCIGGIDFIKNERFNFINLLKQNNVPIRCIDIPLKVNLVRLKKSLLFILLGGNQIEFNTHYISSEQLDTMNSIFPHFDREIYLLIGHLYTNNKRANIDLINQLNTLQKKYESEYLTILKDDFFLYKRILNSFSCYYQYNDISNYKNDQFREKFLCDNLLEVYKRDRCSLTKIGSSHIANTKPIVRGKKYIGFNNMFDLLNRSMSLSYCAFIAAYSWLNDDDDDDLNLTWVKSNSSPIEIADSQYLTFSLFRDTCNCYKGYVLFK